MRIKPLLQKINKKKSVLLMALSFLFMAHSHYAQNHHSWTTEQLGSDLASRFGAGMVALNNKLYILGGYNSCGPKDFTEFDPSSGKLKKLKNLGVSCANPLMGVTVAVKGKIYSLDIYGQSMNVYDSISNNWINKGGLPVSPGSGFVINDTIFLTSSSGNSFYSYNISTEKWHKRADYPGTSGRRSAISFAIGGKGYFGGGTTYGYNSCTTELGCFTRDFYEYDPGLNTWTEKSPLPSPFKFAIGISHNGKGYAGLGEYYDATLMQLFQTNLWYEYTPATDTWARKKNFYNYTDDIIWSDQAVKSASAAVIGNEIFIFGGIACGNNQCYTDNIYKYSIDNNNWNLVDGDPGKNRAEAAGFYSGGKIYVGGGNDSEGLIDFWEYDVATGIWNPKKNFATSYFQRAAVEINGKGYFIGGYNHLIRSTVEDPYRHYADSLLEYNPANDEWVTKASFPGGKRAAMVALAYQGKLFAGFGRGADGLTNHDFYEYTPTTNTWKSLVSPVFDSYLAGYNLSYFVLADTAYVITGASTPVCYKYSFLNNTWTSQTINSISNINANQSFVFKGKAYTTYEGYKIAEYNPTNGNWKPILNMPFSAGRQVIIPTPESVFFGFGEPMNHPLGIHKTNEWRGLKFNLGVSQKIGFFESTYDRTCGTGILAPQASHTVSDSTGKLFLAQTAGSNAIGSVCFEVNSMDTLLPYREMFGKMGKSYDEHGVFLNKSVYTGNSFIGDGILRLYFTTAELNKFVNYFNQKFGTSMTIDSIKILGSYVYNSNDRDPLNNAPSGITLLKPTVSNYGIDKYFEVQGLNGGEIYAVLATKGILTSSKDVFINSVQSIFYPNPASNKIQFTKPSSFIISDITGKVLIKGEGSEVQVSELHQGLYYINISGKIEKFLKQ